MCGVFVMKSFFVTGIDTGVGKTVFTAALANLMRQSGIDVGVMKPFATGMTRNHTIQSEDVELLVKYSGSVDNQNLINPYFFSIPTSPFMAAKKLGKTIDVDVVLSIFEKLQSKHNVMLVEGIGGIMTPIMRDYFVADLIKDLNLETILVSGTKMGSVNHALLTINVCKKYGIKIVGFVLSETDADGYSLDDLESNLTSLSGIDVLCKFPNSQNPVEAASKILKQNNILSRL
ncbi:MAG: dethiobiotin synthase [Nitrososphaeria archaeon]|nr:dethiobiotin synthase [Nitrososphaeria archaeon]NDF35160.1 dethiobiotin synthase [Nitrosopumilaceae archaeon]